MPALATEPFETRMKTMNELFTSAPPVLLPPSDLTSITTRPMNPVQIVDVVEQVQCTGLEMLVERLKALEVLGGEGYISFPLL